MDTNLVMVAPWGGAAAVPHPSLCLQSKMMKRPRCVSVDRLRVVSEVVSRSQTARPLRTREDDQASV